MIDTSQSQLQNLALHWVGNKVKDEALKLSKEESGMDRATEMIFWDYVGTAFKTPQLFAFNGNQGLENHQLFEMVQSVFANQADFLAQTARIAERLYQVSDQPQIKSGELMLAYFNKLSWQGETYSALGIFKSELKQPFMFTEESEETLELYSFKGISPRKVDKAALILNVDSDEGYRILAIDNVDPEQQSFWFKDFLQVRLLSTEYSQTEKLIGYTRSFIEQDLKTEAELSPDQAVAYLQNSKAYWQEEEGYQPEEYGVRVFEDEAVADRFREYVEVNNHEDLALSEPFQIDEQAVQRKQTVFKSVIKLDRNFHIYVHGNRELIERGRDEEGRKYYKIFYEEES